MDQSEDSAEEQIYTPADAQKDFEGSDYESSSDNEEEEEEEEEEDYDDEENDEESEHEPGSSITTEEESSKRRSKSSQKKKKRRRFNPFVELEAQVGEEEEEEEGEEELDEFERQFIAPEAELEREEHEEEEDVGPSAKEYQAMLRQRYLEKEEFDVEAEEQRLKELYGRVRRLDRKRKEGEPELMMEQLLLPTPQDPKLWLVKCRIGKERTVVHQLMKSFLDSAGTTSSLMIQSAIALDNVKGHIYVESYKGAYVAQAIEQSKLTHLCFCGANGSKIALVPMDEMTQVLTVKRSTSGVTDGTYTLPTLGSFVRIKKGKYGSDLGQIVEVPEDDFIDQDNIGRAMVKVKLIPRLPGPTPTNFNNATGNITTMKSALRLPQKLFDPEEMNSLFEGKVHRSRGYWLFDGESYKNGFLYKDFRVSVLQTQAVNPQPQELSLFGESSSTTTAGEEQQESVIQPPLDTIEKDDRVIVTVGEFINLKGTVLEVLDKQVENNNGEEEEKLGESGVVRWVKLSPEDPSFGNTPILVEASQVCKFYSVGDTVDILKGPNQGQQAMVVSFTPGKPLSLFSSPSGQQLDVPVTDVAPSRSKAMSPTNKPSQDDWQVLRQMANLPKANAVAMAERFAQPKRSIMNPREGRSLIGKSVSIAYGPYKGYIGIVKGVTDVGARVELHTNSKLVTVPMDKLILPGGDRSAISSSSSYSTPSSMAKTPAWMSTKTPSYAGAGAMGKTPAWRGSAAAATPSWQSASGKTPSWKTPSTKTAAAAKTPVWEPQPVAKSKTPAWAGSSSVAAVTSNTKTEDKRAEDVTTTTKASQQQQQSRSEPTFAIEGVIISYKDVMWSITKVHSSGEVDLKGLDGNQKESNISMSSLAPVRPQKRERAVVYGDSSSSGLLRGQVIGLDEPDAVVKIDGTGEFKIVKLASLARTL